jgi:hypothetical protein
MWLRWLTLTGRCPAEIIAYYDWDDFYFFAQDTCGCWASLWAMGCYETPGNSFQNLYELNDRFSQETRTSRCSRCESSRPRP